MIHDFTKCSLNILDRISIHIFLCFATYGCCLPCHIFNIDSSLFIKLLFSMQKHLFTIFFIAGQERFHNITTSYYRGAMGIMLVYDITNAKSFDNIAKWLRNIDDHANEARIFCSFNKIIKMITCRSKEGIFETKRK